MHKNDGMTVAVEKKVLLMRTIDFFEHFTPEELSATSQMSHWLKYANGDTIIREGDRCSSFWVILKGAVWVIKRGVTRSEDRVLATIPTGECFGEMSIISGGLRTADIVANSEVFLFKIDGFMLNSAADSLQLKFFKRFAEVLVKRLNKTSQGVLAASRKS